ncbi:MAG TPA: hypothetical protein VFU68_00485 [Terracidiphilus sp.]|nr:hypothetical protein [Terracidiphilus sp.]
MDNALWLLGVLTEAAFVGLLVHRKIWRLLPVFFLYCIFDLASNLAVLPVLTFWHGFYPTFYLSQTVVDSLLVFGVLVELAWSILRPIRSSLPRWTVLGIGAFILLLGAAVWPFCNLAVNGDLTAQIHVIMHLQQTATILRILVFVLLAAGGQLLSIGWKDRELQVATGLGFYSLVSLGVAMLQARQTTAVEYAHWNQLVLASYLCSLLYWTYAFAQKQAERREFTPQMRNLLLAAAGVARSQRMALSEAEKSGPRNGTRL